MHTPINHYHFEFRNKRYAYPPYEEPKEEKGKILYALFRMYFPRNREFPKYLTPYGGSHWYAITPETAQYILQFVNEHPDYLKFHTYTLFAEEIFMQSILVNSKNETIRASLVNDDLRHIDWSRPEPPYPAIFTANDYEELAKSEKIFARKFDTNVDRKILDMIDDGILSRDLYHLPMSQKSTHEPLISVVIPAYNRAATISDCLRSVQAQTYQDWEAIVVDDGSTDSTPEVVTQLAREDARIRLIRQDRNRGAQAARNVGIQAAQGKWIAFLDSDDQYLPHSLESRLEVARAEKVSVVHSSCNIIESDGVMKPYRVEVISGQVYRRLLENEGPTFPGLLVSKKALKRINYLDEKIISYQEWDTVIRLAKFYPFGYEARPTFSWDCRGSDTISKQMVRAGRGYEQVFHKHYVAILRYAGPRVLARHYRIAADWYQRGGDQQAVRRCNFMALVWSSLDSRTALRKMWQLLMNPRTG